MAFIQCVSCAILPNRLGALVCTWLKTDFETLSRNFTLSICMTGVCEESVVERGHQDSHRPTANPSSVVSSNVVL